MTGDTLTDTVRVVALAESLVGVLFTVGIVVLYVGNWRADPARHRFMPWHVGLISLSFGMFAGYCTIDAFRRFGDPFSWRVPYLLVAFGLGVCSQWFMFVVQWRLRAARNRRR